MDPEYFSLGGPSIETLSALSKSQLIDIILRLTLLCKDTVTIPTISSIIDLHTSKNNGSTTAASLADANDKPSPTAHATTRSNPPKKLSSASPQRCSKKGDFDVSKYRQRHIALQIQYDGTGYLGFASQELDQTVENYLFSALTKLKLIQDRRSCRYSRCGRTDKGVSAQRQVVALMLRSAIPPNLPEETPLPAHPCDTVLIPRGSGATNTTTTTTTTTTIDTGTSTDTAADKASTARTTSTASTVMPTSQDQEYRSVAEMDYCSMLNKALPSDIRVIAWCPVTPEFSARFSCASRTYRYFFLRKGLDIYAMQSAADHLVGTHDFRNMCKIDVANVSNFVRDIFYAKIIPFMSSSSTAIKGKDGEDVQVVNPEDIVHGEGAAGGDGGNNEDAMWMLEIEGSAFLWHMIRCIMAVLFFVGEGKEDPSIVKTLLNIERCGAKPSYMMAPEHPLVLHDCKYDFLEMDAQPRTLWHLTAHYRDVRDRHCIAAARALNALMAVEQCTVRQSDVQTFMGHLAARSARHDKKTQQPYQKQRQQLQQQQDQQQQQLILTSSDNAGECGVGIKRRRQDDNDKRANTATAATSDVLKPNADSSCSSSSCGDVHDRDLDPNSCAVWSDVLAQIQQDLQIEPELNSTPYVPLLQRRKEESYFQKVSGLAGNKKERLERHLDLTAAASETTPLFFQHMRKQGSLRAVSQQTHLGAQPQAQAQPKTQT